MQPTTTESLELDTPSIFASEILTESNIASTLGDRDYSKSVKAITQDKSDKKEKHNRPEAKETVKQPIVNDEIVIAEFTTRDLDSLGRLLSRQLKNILPIDEELYVMLIK